MSINNMNIRENSIKGSYVKIMNIFASEGMKLSPTQYFKIINILELKNYKGETPEYTANYMCQKLKQDFPDLFSREYIDGKYRYSKNENSKINELRNKIQELKSNNKNIKKSKKKYKKKMTEVINENQILKNRLKFLEGKISDFYVDITEFE